MTTVLSARAAPAGYPAPVQVGEEVVAWAKSEAVAQRLASLARSPRLRRLVGFKRKRTFLLDPKRVACFELHSGLVHAVMMDGATFTTNYSLRELAHRLAPLDFFPAHRDVVVNLNTVTEIEKLGQGRLRLVLNLPADGGDFKAAIVSRPASARLRKLLRL